MVAGSIPATSAIFNAHSNNNEGETMTGDQIAAKKSEELRAIETPPPEPRALIIVTLLIAGGMAWGLYRAFPALFDWVKGWVL
jgi:hypothetical protein